MSRVLITAGASGIGRAIGEAFDAAGYDVWVTDVDEGALAAVPDGWTARHCDVTDEATMADVMAEVGPLDALCANAGIAGPTALVEDVTLSDWRTCVAVNLDGAFLAVKHALPAMKAAGRGSVIVTSSTAGQYGYPHRSPYAAAKWAVIGLMKTVAMEAGPQGVRANAICPGAVEGRRMEGVLAREAAAKGMTRDDVYDGYAGGTAMRSFVDATDIAGMAVFLASDAARLVSGQVIAVDGFTVNPDPQV
ncbi:MAG: SDR family oxidoreductase [Pseudomonadota bacterium]